MSELFHERVKASRGEYPTTFQYDELPSELRHQIVHNFDFWNKSDKIKYEIVYKRLLESFGIKSLIDNFPLLTREKENDYNKREICEFIKSASDIFRVLSAVELIIVDFLTRVRDHRLRNRINLRFRQAGSGWQIAQNGQIVKIEDETFFNEVTAPCLSVLQSNQYRTALKEYLAAYDDLKNAKYSDAILKCAKAIESLTKSRLKPLISDEDIEHQNWSKLKSHLTKRLNVPAYMQDYQNNMFSLMDGVLAHRNKGGAGHGHSEDAPIEANDLYARFVINQASATLLFLAEAEFNGDK